MALPLIWRVVGILALIAACLGLAVYGVKQIKADGAAAEKAAVVEATAKAQAQAQAETQRRVTAFQGVALDAEFQAAAARASANRAAAARDAMRVQLSAFVARAADPAASTASDSDPIGVLAEVLGRFDDAAGRYASEADANRIGWDACVGAYQALTP